MHIQGQPPDPEQENMEKATADQWRKVQVEAPMQAVVRAEDAAKQLIVLTGTLQTLYFAVYAFSDLRKQIGDLHIQGFGLLIWLIFFLPIVLSIISFYCATRVFIPKEHFEANTSNISLEGWKTIREAYEVTAREKLRWLRRSHRSLAFSFASVLIVLMIFIFLPTSSGMGPTQIIIVTPTPVITPTP